MRWLTRTRLRARQVYLMQLSRRLISLSLVHLGLQPYCSAHQNFLVFLCLLGRLDPEGTGTKDKTRKWSAAIESVR